MDQFPLKVLIVSASSVESARMLVLLSSVSRDISLRVVSAGSLENTSDISLPANGFELLIFDLKCAAEIEKLKDLVGNLADKFIFLSDEDSTERVIADCPPGCVGHVRKPLSYHKMADGLGRVGIHLRKLNCWEYNLCGRGTGQTAESGLDVCPVAIETTTTGMNEGTMGGRVCWAIGGSFCEGEKQGSFASKILNCQECDFYKLVHEEQGQYSESINSILGRMKHQDKG